MTDLLTSYAPPRLITRGLVAHYDFKSGAGQSTLYDLTPGNRHGTLQAGPLWNNGGIAFDGSTQYVTRVNEPASTVLHVLGVYQVSSFATLQALVGRWGTTSTTRDWLVEVTTGGAFRATARKSGTQATATSAVVALNTWFFGDMYFDGTNVAARVNTGAYTLSALSGVLQTGGTWNMARINGGTEPSAESAAYYLEYDRALSADEVNHNYFALKTILAQRGIALP